MIGDVILPSTTAADWPALRQSIYQRITATMGTAPAYPTGKPQWKEIKRYVAYDLTHVLIKYQVIDDDWNEAIIVLPGQKEPAKPAPAVLTIHGHIDIGKDLMLNDKENPDHFYPVELARRGYVAMALDQYGYGAWIAKTSRGQLVESFYKRWPNWSLDGRRVFEQKIALDVLTAMGFVDPKRFGAMGNSLGGRATMYLTALDERIVVGVPSTGISPNCSNVYRSVARDSILSPALSKVIGEDGRIPWEYNEMVALVAPRALMVIEPYNDDFNPDVAPTMECVYRAASVFKRLGCPEKLSMFIHGRGHATPPDIRQMAYAWLDRHSGIVD